ncbi:MAG: Nramp family divalent metal transporter [Candidatus Eremiobacteraeota bacterium]|nr:Nramp family divalent metal transporter [Candidatus Eremiobacteraeota bacterium]
MEAVQEKSRRRLRFGAKAMLFFAVFGPGLITASADNDVGGITVYSQAGAQFGYSILWTLIPITIALMVVQEMSARMGAVTGKGLAGLIREHFGVRWTFFVMLAFVASNIFTTSAEFAGVAVAAKIFHLSAYIAVPAVALLVFVLVLRTGRGVTEKVFLIFSALYFTYVISGFRAHPNWHDVWRGFLVPTISHDQNYLWMIIALIGTTISPWMQFYIQSSIVEKGIRVRDYAFSRIDVLFGCFITDFMSFFMILATAATIFVFNVAHPHHQYIINETSDAARALEPIAGGFAAILFGFGILNAGIFTASILPLSTAFFVCEAGGFESGVNKRFSEAPAFFSLYAGVIAVGALLVLLPGIPLLRLINYSQIVSGILLPFLLIFMLILINKKSLMGDHRNGPVLNIVAWATAVSVAAITLLSVYQTISRTFFS